MVTFTDHFYSKYFYGRRAMLSIGNVLPLRGILEGTIICNIEHYVSDHGVFARASMDYAIMITTTLITAPGWGALPAREWPPWLMDVSDISSSFMNWPI